MRRRTQLMLTMDTNHCTHDCAQGRHCNCDALIQASTKYTRDVGCWCIPDDDPAEGLDKWADVADFIVGAICAIITGLILGYGAAEAWGIL